jgi:phenylalanine ammonia-lyase
VVLAGIEASRRRIGQAIGEGRPLYGVNTGFGGMGDVPIPAEDAAELQHNLIRFLKAGSGERLPVPEVRSAMLLLANALARGVSGIRPELIERLAVFLNEDVTPHVPALGSIGASGDLIPLAAIAGALIGLDDAFLVEHGGESLPSPKLLERLSLRPLALEAKEGLALVNGTAVLTGMAAGCVHDAQVVLAVSLGIHALAIQGLNASDGPFDPFIHRHKPHPGQIFAAARMRELLAGSKLLHRAETWPPGHTGRLIQDRYSVRCLPQFLGPVLDAVAVIADQVATEMNSTTDNPLIDGESGATFHGGNFLGQYIGVGMDQLRYFLGLVVKHLDAQIALLVEPAFNSGLPASLVGNPSRRVNMGLKGLQIGANSIMPLILHLGNPLVPHFPTHAEQFNQNINSQGFGSANLARQSLDLCRRYLAHALIFGVQAVSLRARLLSDNGDARSFLSPETLPLHETVRDLVGRRCDPQKPLVFDDHEQALDAWLSVLTADLAGGGRLEQAVAPVLAQIRAHAIDPVRVDSGVVPGRSSPTHGEGPP